MAGNFDHAVRQMIVDALVCPKCQAMNRPGALIIELTPPEAVCNQCAHSWPVDLRVDPR